MCHQEYGDLASVSLLVHVLALISRIWFSFVAFRWLFIPKLYLDAHHLEWKCPVAEQTSHSPVWRVGGSSVKPEMMLDEWMREVKRNI